jgi:hypothetical protein
MAAPIAPMALVAPGPVELATATLDLDDRLARAAALAEVMGRLHGAWGEALATGATPDACADPAFGSLLARSRAFGAAYRDAVQDARASLDRLAYIQTAVTIVPLLDARDRTEFARDRAEVERHAAVYLELRAWQTKFVEPSARDCDPPLSATDGIAWTGAVAATDLREVGVIATGGGYVCPGAWPADGRAVVVSGLACIAADATCGCVPTPVQPGAVLTSR